MSAPKIGVVGGGQLARMMNEPAIALGLDLHCLAENDAACALGAIAHSQIGDYRDEASLADFAEQVDVLTFDHEHVPGEFLERLEAKGVQVHPRPAALRFAQDKILMREKMDELGLPNPHWTRAQNSDDVLAFAHEHGFPVVLKTARGGYDGKGVALIREPTDLERYGDWFPAPGTTTGAVLVEEFVPFARELSALVARTPSGEVRAWPVVATQQTEGVCDEVIAPAPELDPELEEQISRTALRIAEELDITGVFAVELFQTDAADPRGFLINELAMRPHNTGHWTQDASMTSQFEQHLRAALDLPLGDTSMLGEAAIMKNILGGDNPDLPGAYPAALASDPGAKVHLYGKHVRSGRKVGHVNRSVSSSSDLPHSLATVREIVQKFREGATHR